MRCHYAMVTSCLMTAKTESKNCRHLRLRAAATHFCLRTRELLILTSFSCGETVYPMLALAKRGAAMNGRLISAASLAGLSFGLITCTVLGANALEGPNSVRSEGVRLSWDITAGRSSSRAASAH